MKLPCNVIRDLLPLYAEDMVSPESRALTEAAGANRLPYRVHPQPKNPFLNPSAMPFPPKTRFEGPKNNIF